MQIDVITLFPAMFDGLRDNGISRVALESGAASLACYNPRDFTDDAYHTVDGRPYGGGPGMVMLPGPLDRSIDADGVQIFIGEESGYQMLDNCSVVTAPYRVDDEIVDVLGVIGPTRMAYERVIPIVDITAKLLGSALDPAAKQ